MARLRRQKSDLSPKLLKCCRVVSDFTRRRLVFFTICPCCVCTPSILRFRAGESRKIKVDLLCRARAATWKNEIKAHKSFISKTFALSF